MRLLTLNTHSHVEEDYREKLEAFVQAVSEEEPDVIALQEVNQTIAETPVKAGIYRMNLVFKINS